MAGEDRGDERERRTKRGEKEKGGRDHILHGAKWSFHVCFNGCRMEKVTKCQIRNKIMYLRPSPTRFCISIGYEEMKENVSG
jgi:hypothetical protein